MKNTFEDLGNLILEYADLPQEFIVKVFLQENGDVEEIKKLLDELLKEEEPCVLECSKCEEDDCNCSCPLY